MLRALFDYIAGINIEELMRPQVENIAAFFKVTDVAGLLKNAENKNPIIYFYETFLGKYDPQLRKKRGVFCTPDAVVGFMVRAVDTIVKETFKLPEGLADTALIDYNGEKMSRVQILDPATGTFLIAIMWKIYKTYETQQGMWNDYVQKHLIASLNGFEILIPSIP